MDIFNNPWQTFRGTIRGFDSPGQLALGATMGMLIGLLPKDSALPYVFALITLLSNGNLLCAAVSGVLFSCLGPTLDTITHPIGLYVLSSEVMQPTFAWLYELPFARWTRFENTVVMGSLLLGLVAALPLHLVSKRLFMKYGGAIHHRILNNRLAQWLIGPPESQIPTNLQQN